MCRHLAYLGPPVTLRTLLLEPEHSLLRQSYEPRRQAHGRVNADGFGAGWYVPDVRPEPARYRRPVPMWADQTFADLAGTIRSGAIVASVRNASPGLPVNEVCTPPYGRDRWLFTHNGSVLDWHGPKGAGVVLRRRLTDAALAATEGSTDSEVLFGLVLDAIDDGASPPDAMAAVVDAVETVSPGSRLNLVLSDGATLVATAYGDTLFTRCDDDAIVVASEPYDDDPAWRQLEDRSLVVATRTSFDVGALT
jgi:glutamine amidotransferase